MSHSLLDKLVTLEGLFHSANEKASLEELNLLLSCLEDIVTCAHCREEYEKSLVSASKICLEWRISRVQNLALKSFSILERELGKEPPQQKSLARYLNSVSQSAVAEARALGLTADSRVLFIGCGSRPISCHALSTFFGCQVLGIDMEADCIRAARGYSLPLAQSSRLAFELGEGASFGAKGFTQVIVASLVSDKEAILAHLASELRASSKIAVRFGEGLHRLMNYPMPEIDEEFWDILRVDENPRGFYQTLYLQRTSL